MMKMWKNLAYDAIYLLPLSLIPVLWSSTFMDGDIKDFWLYIIPITISFIGLLFFHLKEKGKVILSASVFALASMLFIITSTDGKIEFLKDHLNVVLFVLMSLGSFLICKVICLFRMGKRIISAGLFISLIVSLFVGIYLRQSVVALIFTVVFASVIEEIQLHWDKTSESNNKDYLVFLTPFLAVIFIIIILFPASDEPYEWRWVKKIYQTVSEAAEKLNERIQIGHGSGYDDGFIGFSEYGDISGNVKDSNDVVFIATLGWDAAKEAYLSGKTFDTFENGEWTKTYEESNSDALFDSLETVYTINGYTPDISDYYRNSTIRIRMMDMKTDRVFSPGKIVSMRDDDDKINFIDEGGDLYFEKKRGYDYSYEMYFYRINRDNEAFKEMVLADKPDSEGRWKLSLNRVGVPQSGQYSYENYLAYRERMKDVYLKDVEISPELNAYLDEELAGIDNDYDKLLKLEELLRSMNYSKNPGLIPSDIDTDAEFLDYMILDKQEGFCSHYATAFVLIARSMGIPARYVQGYKIVKQKDKEIPVLQNNAHSWAECYFEGVGWIVFEPTPGMETNQYWKTKEEIASAQAAANQNQVTEIPPEPEMPEAPTPVGDSDDTAPKKTVRWEYIVIPIVTAIIVAVAILLTDWIFNRVRYKSLKDEKKYIVMIKRNLYLIRILGHVIKDCDTLEEFKRECKKDINPECLSFIDIYERYVYDDYEVGEKDIKTLESAYTNLAKMISSKGWKYRIKLLRHYFVIY